jgi:hypothetical protein
VTLTCSTVSGNRASGYGGGILSSGTLSLISSTISNNVAGNEGGGLAAGGHTVIRHSTITENTLTYALYGRGGGIFAWDETEIYSSIIAGNENGDVEGATSLLQSQGFNLIGTGNAVGEFQQTGDLVGVEPRLTPLRDNGGPTLTHALLPGSPAINGGDPAALAGVGEIPLYDQRGTPYPRVHAGRSDIGALEAPSMLVVTQADDVVDPSDGLTSLREAILAANHTPGEFLIYLPAGTYSLSRIGGFEDDAQLGDLDIRNSTGRVAIYGAGANQAILDASALADRIFDIHSGAALDLVDLTLAHGTAPGDAGGAVRNQIGGRLLLTTSTLRNNAAYFGGGIYNDGEATVVSSTLSDNEAQTGGGILNAGELTVAASTLFGNRAAQYGGGIANSAQATVSNSTLSGNVAELGGGGLANAHTATIRHTTITNNQVAAGLGAGVVSLGAASTEVRSTIIAANQADDVGFLFSPTNSFISTGFNLVGDGNAVGAFQQAGDLVGVAPRLGPLSDNGGPTLTHALLLGSPAINAGDPTDVVGAGDVPLFDQRGSTQRKRADRIDIGSWEAPYLIIVDEFNDIISSSDGRISLREAILTVNRVEDYVEIFLLAGNYRLTRQGSTEDLALRGDLDIVSKYPVTIRGAGADHTTIDAGGLNDRIFEVTANLEISGVTLTNGKAVNDVGGAMRIKMSSRVTVTDSQFLSNSAGRAGGGIVNDGELTVSNSNFVGNSSHDGGGISNHGQVMLTDSTFVNNSAIGSGGGVWSPGDATVTDSTFSGNTAWSGGGIGNDGNMTLTASSFSENRVTDGGGAIANGHQLIVSAVTMSHNDAGSGGGIYNFGNLVGTAVILMENVGGSGGGICNSGTLILTTSTLTENFAHSHGGAIMNYGDMTLTDSTLSGNTAYEGGAINNSVVLTVAASTLSNNSAHDGGGIYNDGDLTMTASVLSGNNAYSQGGGIYNYNRGLMVVLDSTLSNNAASVSGGAIANVGQLELRSSSLAGNIAGFGGGIANSQYALIINSTLSDNEADQYGGGIANWEHAVITHSTITGNRARDFGAGVASFDLTEVGSTIIAGNQASDLDDYTPLDVVISHGFNLVGTGNAVEVFQQPGDLVGVDPLLGPLADNGGPTLTHALLPGSPAINAGDPSAVAGVGDTPLYDQRGASHTRVGLGRIDIGAFESTYSSNRLPTADVGGPYALAEGQSLQLDASASTDPDPLDLLTFTWDVNGDGIFGDAAGVSPMLTWEQLQALGIDNGPGAYHIKVRVDDGHGTPVESIATSLNVSNAPPVVAATGPTSAYRGETLTFTFSAADPSSADQTASFTYRIDWDGNGSVDQTVVGPGSGIDVEHQYFASRAYSIQVTVEDADGGRSEQGTLPTLAVTDYVLRSDGQGRTDLIWGGTKGVDGAYFFTTATQTIVIYAVFENTAAISKSYTVAGVSGKLIAYGFDQNDVFIAELLGTRRAILVGGDGDDLLIGGLLADTLDGGDGDDLLLGGTQISNDADLLMGGAGDDLLIGHTGADTLQGDAGSDLLMGDAFQFGNLPGAVVALHAEWGQSGHTYSERVANLLGLAPQANRLNGDWFLTPASTIHRDTVVDTLHGGTETDWFVFTFFEDEITDHDGAEFQLDSDP